MSRPTLSYRPEIDGLRAVAVGAVILYHASISFRGVDLFQGGFLGVDVFLVISGYLIASLILKEYSASSSFSYLNFYARRVRRLLPALLLVLLATVPLAWIYMMPGQLVDFAESLVSVLLFSSNFHFHLSLQEYGAESALLKPLLHCWSLSLEEQFYLLFPVAFVAVLHYLRRHLILVVCAAGIGSLVFAQWASGAQPSMAFYLLPWRSWELLGGVLLAGLEYKNQGRPRTGMWNIGAALGLLLILASMAWFDPTTQHPSLLTLIPVLGTMLVIWFAGPSDLCGRLLSNRVFVWIGLISYSLYLWHYPIFAFGRLAHAIPSRTDKVLWILLSVSLSAISYRWLERPFRDARRTSRRLLWLTLGGASLLLFAFSFIAIDQEGLPFRFHDLKIAYGKNEFDNEVLKLRSWEPLESRALENGLPLGRFEHTRRWYSDTESRQRRRVLVVGNSHSKDLYNAIDQNREYFPHIEVARYGIEIQDRKNEKAWNRFLKSPNFIASDVVVISTRYRIDQSVDDIDDLSSFIKPIRDRSKLVIITSNTPEFLSYKDTPIFDYYARDQHELPDESALANIYYQRLDPWVLRNNVRLKEVADQMGVTYIDKVELTCQPRLGSCAGVTPDGYKMYYDYGHLTLEGARYVGQLIHQRGWLQLP